MIGSPPTGEREREADRQLFAGLYPALRRLAAIVASYEIDPDDLVQEAVTRALDGGALARFDSPEAYLRRIIINLAANDRRRFGRRRRAMARFAQEVQEGASAQYPSDLSDLLQLPPRTRAMLYLREIEGLPYEEIAALNGVSPAAARMAVSRALRTLRSATTESAAGEDHR